LWPTRKHPGDYPGDEQHDAYFAEVILRKTGFVPFGINDAHRPQAMVGIYVATAS
jgi:hypothetical protein